NSAETEQRRDRVDFKQPTAEAGTLDRSLDTRPQPRHTSRDSLDYPDHIMVIDKSWTCLGRHKKALFTGLKKFIEHCKPLVNSSENIKCPCKSCRNVSWVTIRNLSEHLTKYRWDPSYKTWTNHGEPNLPSPVIDNTRQPQMSDMTACLKDLSYIPPNNEQDEPSQGDIRYESMHACINDCFLFQGEDNKDVHFCPMCNTSRWKDSNTPGKKVPKKVLQYFLIIPRLQCLYKSSHTAKKMTWHATEKCTDPGLDADGFNPLGNLSQSYSMWPVILTTYNLPLWLCMKESSFMLTLLIPGPKSPGKDIYVYLRPLIDDLKDLWVLKGVKTIDVATGQKFNMRTIVL
nr:hypothetical protein [Tanacetum cinerariifolium]